MTTTPPCFEVPTPGVLCSYHAGRLAGRNDCWNLRDARGDHCDGDES